MKTKIKMFETISKLFQGTFSSGNLKPISKLLKDKINTLKDEIELINLRIEQESNEVDRLVLIIQVSLLEDELIKFSDDLSTIRYNLMIA